MLGRLLTALVHAQAGWARPLGDLSQRALAAIYRPLAPVKDFLNGKWLGHSLHAALSDLPIGILTLGLLFDLLNLQSAADIAVVAGLIALIATAVAGTADYVDTDGRARTVATVHAVLMTTGLVLYLVSLVLRAGHPDERGLLIVLAFLGYGVITLGAWTGGEVVYALGNMVSRHAWRFWSAPRWQPLEVGELLEGIPTKGRAGGQSLILVREGDRLHALHDVCAHAGGSLSEGRIVDGCIECPLHQSRYELSTGRRTQGPTTYDQPSYEVRRDEAGRLEARRIPD